MARTSNPAPAPKPEPEVKHDPSTPSFGESEGERLDRLQREHAAKTDT